MPVRPHFLMELHVSLACAVPNGKYFEYIPQLDQLAASRLPRRGATMLAVAPRCARNRRQNGISRL